MLYELNFYLEYLQNTQYKIIKTLILIGESFILTNGLKIICHLIIQYNI